MTVLATPCSRWLCLATLSLALALPAFAAAQDAASDRPDPRQAPAAGSEPTAAGLWVRARGGQRLSESWMEARQSWMGAQAGAAPLATEAESAPYTLGLMWIAPQARTEQRRHLRRVLATLSQVAERQPAAAAALSRLRQDLASLPITGRVPLPAQDMAWLQAHPSHDPVLAEGDEWWLPTQPQVVRVWISSGERCDIPFRPDQLSQRYVSQCAASAEGLAALADTVFLVQPDGRVQEIGIAAWNASQQALPAPGAWIWAARRDAGLTLAQQSDLAQWLATQGAAGAEPVPSAERLTAESAMPTAALSAGPSEPRARSLPVTASDWGVTGLLQTPTARTRPAGAFGMAVSRAWPYTQWNLTMSPFDRVELAVRYTTRSNTLYGEDIAGQRSAQDKSAELKLRLVDEGVWTPAVTLGLRDPGGTGLFAGEYVVGSKRWGDFDLSLGLGWGYLGARGDLPNPLSILGDRFSVRHGSSSASGGTANIMSMFTGRTALFGGVQWHTPWDSVVVKLELDGNDYQSEPSGHRFDAPLPVNAGVAWRWGDAELGVSWQRGNRWSFSLAWMGSLAKLGAPKSSLPRMPAIEPIAVAGAAPMALTPTPKPAAAAPASSQDGASPATPPQPSAAAPAAESPAQPQVVPPAAVAADPAISAAFEHAILVELAQHSGWHATRLVREPGAWTAHFDHAGGAYVRDRIERIWAVLHREAPADVKLLALELASRQMPMVRHEVDRAAWADARSRFQARHQQPSDAPVDGVKPVMEPKTTAVWTPAPHDTPRVAVGVNLGFQQHLGGPDGYLYALSVRGFGQLRLWQGAWVQGNLQARLLDNYDGFAYTAPSLLPRVRTHMREFVTTSRITMPNLQFTQAGRLAPGIYGMAYAGYLEPMFAGVGAELLWRPLNSRWAASLDLNLVRKRDFAQDFGLQVYQVKTGHVTVRYDTGWHDIVAGVSAGQYLAGDRGVTVDLSRVFANGTRMGLWATKTNVSAAQFGEGSFDKGLYMTVPFDALFTSWSGSAMTVAWQPLIRDGGAKLQRGASLWGLTDTRDLRIMDFRPGEANAPTE